MNAVARSRSSRSPSSTSASPPALLLWPAGTSRNSTSPIVAACCAAWTPRAHSFLGCTLDPDEAFSLRARGAPVFPEVPDVPVKQYRSALYTPAELFGGLSAGYHETLDARVYAWSRQPPDLDRSLAKALHDHAIDDALRNVVRGKTRTLPVWPALQALAAGRDMGPRVHLVDELDDAVARLVGDPAVAPGPSAE